MHERDRIFDDFPFGFQVRPYAHPGIGDGREMSGSGNIPERVHRDVPFHAPGLFLLYDGAIDIGRGDVSFHGNIRIPLEEHGYADIRYCLGIFRVDDLDIVEIQFYALSSCFQFVSPADDHRINVPPLAGDLEGKEEFFFIGGERREAKRAHIQGESVNVGKIFYHPKGLPIMNRSVSQYRPFRRKHVLAFLFFPN
jgi:hypothetical protein